eukprot:1878778-Pleurochrysis_carterae.AAC.1
MSSQRGHGREALVRMYSRFDSAGSDAALPRALYDKIVNWSRIPSFVLSKRHPGHLWKASVGFERALGSTRRYVTMLAFNGVPRHSDMRPMTPNEK